MRETKWIIVLSFLCGGLAITGGCGSHGGRANSPEPTATKEATQRKDHEAIEIKSIEFFAHRRVGAEKVYSKIDNLTSPEGSPVIEPELFDVVVQLENKSRSSIQHGDLILLATIEFAVAPGYPGEDNAAAVMSQYSWSRVALVDDVKTTVVPFMESGKQDRVVFAGFDLAEQNKLLADDRTIISRVWAIKATVHVLNWQMAKILQRDAVIALSR